MNPKPTRVVDHGDFELEDLYHERVKIPDRLIEYIWRNKKMEMRVQIVGDVAPIFVVFAPNLFHHNNVGVTYVGTFNFKLELVRFVPLYYVAMPHSKVIVIEVPFTTAPAHTIASMRLRP